MNRRAFLIRLSAMAPLAATGLGACGDGPIGPSGGEPAVAPGSEVELKQDAIYNGSAVFAGSHEAVVRLSDALGTLCSGTLISDTLVLTAAHCLRPDCGTQDIGGTINVTFHGVSPGPGGLQCSETWFTTRTTTARWVGVHPQFCQGAWASNDYALLRLDEPASSIVCVKPLQIAPTRPAQGAQHTLVGYGGNAQGCSPEETGLGTKRAATLTLSQVWDRSPAPLAGTALVYSSFTKYACPADSGGPSLNNQGVIEGVASWGNLNDNSNYAAAYLAPAWLGAVVHDGLNHGGAAQVFVAGSYDHTAMNVVPNDSISSMKVAPGFEVQLWAESGGWGDTGVYTGLVNNVGALMNNRASHIAVRPGVTLYREGGFGGVNQTLTAGNHDVGALSVVGNDQISSLVVAPGMRVTACTEGGFWNCRDYTGSVGDLADFNDQVSSVIVGPM
jgi:trypsin